MRRKIRGKIRGYMPELPENRPDTARNLDSDPCLAT
jgi:hypothetical protein